MTLVTFDTDSIKSYVFATSKLKEIRGASTLLDDLNDRGIRAIVGEDRIVYAGGGTALAEVDGAQEAERLINQVAQMYRYETRAAEITGAYIEKRDPEVKFGEYVRRLNFELRLQKESKPRHHSRVTSPVLKACESCGQNPASNRANDDALICDACSIKRERSRKIRSGNLTSRFDQMTKYAQKKGEWQHITGENAPEDFNDIGDAASPKGYIGFIYCDGNRMASLINSLETPESFQYFSSAIRDVLEKMTFDTLLEYFPEAPASRRFPFEIIFLGGDDLMLVVAADKAIEIAIRLCKEFEKRTARVLEDAGVFRLRKHLSLSAAVVFSHASLPIYYLQTIADDLLKSAKRRSQSFFEDRNQEGEAEEVSCIDFHVVTASASESPTLLRKINSLRRDEETYLTERPYTAGELEALIERIRALKRTGFPSNKLQMLYESIVGKSMTQAMFTWAFVAGRARRSDNPEKNQMLKLFDFFSDTTGSTAWPWRRHVSGRLTTPFMDVTELYDFIK
jgi:hypothetical protein